MLTWGSEQKTLCRISPDATQILYLVPGSGKSANEMPKLMRRPIDGGPSEVMISDQAINHFACSRAPASICIYSALPSTQMVFSVFDPVKEIHTR